MERTYQIFVVLDPVGQPYPCTAACTVARCRELAEVAFAELWPVLKSRGWRVAAGTLAIGAVINERSALSWANRPRTDDDRYYNFWIDAGAQLVADGRGDWIEYTQWTSGATLWRSPDGEKTVLIDAVQGVQS